MSELPPNHFAAFDDDGLGALASRAALSEVPWTPDVAGTVTERLARDAAAYPELFAPGPPAQPTGAPAAATVNASRSTPPESKRRSRSGFGLATAGLVTAVAVIGVSVFLSDPGRTAPSAVRSAGQLTESAAELEAAPVIAVGSARIDPPKAATDARSEAQPPAVAIVAARPGRDGRIGARIQFDGPPADIAREAHQTELLRKVKGGAWKPVASVDGATTIETSLVPGKRYDFRIRALDDAGNVISSRRVRAVLTVRHWTARSIDRTPGDWTTTTGDPKLGGALASKTSDATITTSFSGNGVALVAPVGPAGGAMRVRVDGGDWERGDLSDAEPADREVVFSRHLEDGEHSLDIAVDDGVIALDSMMIVRTPEAWPRRS